MYNLLALLVKMTIGQLPKPSETEMAVYVSFAIFLVLMISIAAK